MIFAFTWQAVLAGTKTVTSRRVKAGDVEKVAPLPTDEIFHQGDKMYLYHPANESRAVTVIERNGRHTYYVGQELAIQPGRGKPALWYNPANTADVWQYGLRVELGGRTLLKTDAQAWLREQGYVPARIRVTQIARHDVRTISAADVTAEGFDSRVEFFQTWTEMHDKPVTIVRLDTDADNPYRVIRPESPNGWWRCTEQEVVEQLQTRPAEQYDAWQIRFELAGG